MRGFFFLSFGQGAEGEGGEKKKRKKVGRKKNGGVASVSIAATGRRGREKRRKVRVKQGSVVPFVQMPKAPTFGDGSVRAAPIIRLLWLQDFKLVPASHATGGGGEGALHLGSSHSRWFRGLVPCTPRRTVSADALRERRDFSKPLIFPLEKGADGARFFLVQTDSRHVRVGCFWTFTTLERAERAPVDAVNTAAAAHASRLVKGRLRNETRLDQF